MRQIKQLQRHLSFRRTAWILPAIISIIGGLAFAALVSQQDKLVGNRIETATAGLLISKDGIHYSTSEEGFLFDKVIPGAAASEDGPLIYLKNTGETNLKLKFRIDNIPQNPDNVDLSKVYLVLHPQGGTTAIKASFSELISSNMDGGNGLSINAPSKLAPDQTISYHLGILMDEGAVESSGASVDNINFAFNGTAASSSDN